MYDMIDSVSSSSSIISYPPRSSSSTITIPHSLLNTPNKSVSIRSYNDTTITTPLLKQCTDLSPLCASPLPGQTQWPALHSNITTSPILSTNHNTLTMTPGKSAHSILCSPFQSPLQRTSTNLFISPSRHNPFINHTYLHRTNSKVRDTTVPLIKLDAGSPAPAPSGLHMMVNVRQKEQEHLAKQYDTIQPSHNDYIFITTVKQSTIHDSGNYNLSQSHHKPRRTDSNVKRPLFTDTDENTNTNIVHDPSRSHKKSRINTIEPALHSLQSLSSLLQPNTPKNRLIQIKQEHLHSGSNDSQHSVHTSGSNHTRASGTKRTVLFQHYSGSGRTQRRDNDIEQQSVGTPVSTAVVSSSTPITTNITSPALIATAPPHTTDITPSATRSNDSKPTHCNCSKTQCIKLYCQCFANSRQCTSACACKDCCNDGTTEHQHIHQQARRQLLDKDSTVFTLPRPERNRHTDVEILTDTLTGKRYLSRPCHCKKTHCTKKYCDCYVAGVECSDQCSCHQCMNGNQTHTSANNTVIHTHKTSKSAQKNVHDIPVVTPTVSDPHELARLQLRMQLQQNGVLSK